MEELVQGGPDCGHGDFALSKADGRRHPAPTATPQALPSPGPPAREPWPLSFAVKLKPPSSGHEGRQGPHSSQLLCWGRCAARLEFVELAVRTPFSPHSTGSLLLRSSFLLDFPP